MTNETGFLSGLLSRTWSPDSKYHLQPEGLFIGKGRNAIEVAVARSAKTASRTELLEVWRHRKGGRASPVLLVVLHGENASLCGPSGDEPPVYPQVESGQAERLCHEVLDQPDRHAALRFLAQALPSLETTLPGLNNTGFVALHELQEGVPKRQDWENAGRLARRVLGKRDQELLVQLGFEVERLDNLTHLLRGGNRRAALAVMLKETESAEAGTPRFNSLSPVSYGLSKADAESLQWLILVQGNRLRLYSTAMNAGVGRRGRTETFIECQPTLLSDENLPYLWLLFSADALAEGGTLPQILDDSQRFAGDLAERLRERIYDEVVPKLAQGIASATGLEDPSQDQLDHVYQMALTVLFRLLFIAYAEDRDLLPYRVNDAYRRRSLKQKAQELADCVANATAISDGTSHWQEVSLLCEAVATGNRQWGVPAYDGGLFANDANVSVVGADLANIEVENQWFEAALRQLLVIETPENVPGPVDFRSLGVREFGTIYEGLLESELSVADVDLVLRKQKNTVIYYPAKEDEQPALLAGEVYLHNRSGARKSTGSYYTKHFAVEHLLDGALEPALSRHFEKLKKMDDADASSAFFDFRVADIAMGSGHFLTAAIDRIEKGMTDFLANRNLSSIRKELSSLRHAAVKELGDLADTAEIEDGQLLRRLIARRCIYGVDLNALSVQLARVAIWIHTFVPGLPLSVLDHTLVHGNSLVGVGTIEDIKTKFEETEGSLFAVDASHLLGQAAKPLSKLANINDATLQDIAAARKAIDDAREATRGTEALCDLITAQPVSEDEKVAGFPFEDWERRANDNETSVTVNRAREDLDGLHTLHFPIAFPEVFLRDRPGFDVIIGNPPWEEATVEEHGFWARHFPGLRALSQREQEAEKENFRNERPDLVTAYEKEVAETMRMRKLLVSGTYPGMGTGDPDVYKAFCWRFWQLTARDGGRIGVVLPRSALAAKGSMDFRLTMFRDSAMVDVAMLVNNRRWVFPEVHPQYSIALVCITHGKAEEKSVRLRGPYHSHAAYTDGIKQEPAAFDNDQVLSWNDTVSLPLLPSPDSIEVFAQLRSAPRLDLNEPGEWRARPDRELDATNQKYLMDVDSTDCPPGFWPVYKGESFDIWNPDTGTYYAYADPEPVIAWLQDKRLRAGQGRRDSPHGEFSLEYLRDKSTLPCFKPRIAFRDVSRATDTRTTRAALVPSNVFITNKGPYFLWPRGCEEDQAFLLGVLCSIPLDWYARRFVEVNVNYFIINPFPIPRLERKDSRWQQIVALAGRLASPDDRFAGWAAAVGTEHGPLNMKDREEMVCKLDALVAHAYGLKKAHLVHIFETFHEGWAYEQRLHAVIEHYKSLDN